MNIIVTIRGERISVTPQQAKIVSLINRLTALANDPEQIPTLRAMQESCQTQSARDLLGALIRWIESE